MRAASVSEQMIEQQVRAWDVLDERVLDTMRGVPRERFAPPLQRFRAYADAEVPLANGQHMLRPSVAGRFLQALLPQPGDSVLEIGTGSGFLTACLRAMAARVRSLEIFPAHRPTSRFWSLMRLMKASCAPLPAGVTRSSRSPPPCPATMSASRNCSPSAGACWRWSVSGRLWRRASSAAPRQTVLPRKGCSRP